MSIRVRLATPADFDAVRASPSPALFDARFVAFLARASGYPDVSLALEDGGDLYVLPVLRRRALGIYPLHFSLPFGHHGSLYPEPRDPATYRALLLAARRHLGGSLVVQNLEHGVASAARLPSVATHEAHVLRTRGVTYEELFKKTFDAKLRNQIRKAEKSGLRVVSGNDRAAVGMFHLVYLLSNQRWGTEAPKYSREFFEAFCGAPFFEIRAALHEDRPIAAIVVLKFRDQHLYWFGAMDKSEASRCPNHLLIAEALKDAIASGTGFYNFGVSGRLDTVRKFKESFGAEPRSYESYFVGNRLVERELRRRMKET